MARWSESPAAELVLSQAEIGVIVADRDGIVMFSNEYVARLLRLTGPGASLVGEPLGGLGLLPDSEPGRAAEIARQVLSGVAWEDTFAGHRTDGSLLFVRELAVPLRRPVGRDRRHRDVHDRGRAARRAARAGPPAAARADRPAAGGLARA